MAAPRQALETIKWNNLAAGVVRQIKREQAKARKPKERLTARALLDLIGERHTVALLKRYAHARLPSLLPYLVEKRRMCVVADWESGGGYTIADLVMKYGLSPTEVKNILKRRAQQNALDKVRREEPLSDSAKRQIASFA